MARAKKQTDREIADQITQWRNEGLTDAQIVAKHGAYNLNCDYKWLKDNPAVVTGGEPTTQVAPPRPPSGASYRAAPLPAS